MNWKKVTSIFLLSSMAVVNLSGCSVSSSSYLSGSSVEGNLESIQRTKGKFGIVRDFSTDKGDDLEKVQGDGSFGITDGTLEVVSNAGDDLIVIDQSAPDLHNVEVEFTFDPKNDNQGAMYGVILRYDTDGSWTFVGQDGHSAKDPFLTSWVLCTSDGKKEQLLVDGQRVYAGRQEPYTMKVRLVENALTLYLDHVMIYSGEVDGVTQGSGKAGIRYVNGSGANISHLNVAPAGVLEVGEKEGEARVITSPDLVVSMDKNFPRIMEYELSATKGKLSGQKEPYYAVEVNNVLYTPEMTSEFTDDRAVYHLTVKELGVSFDVAYEVKGNVLRQEIQNIKEKDVVVKTINFPNQSLVSMANDTKNSELRVNNYRTEQIYALADVTTQRAYQTTSLAVLSNDEIAASINNGNINNRQEIAYQTVLTGDGYMTGLWNNEYQYRGLDQEPIDALWTEVAITGDRNGDGAVDYQDGAIARRDDIGTVRLGSDDYQDSMSMIAMDVGSIAQYPFLRILDNIKKFSLGTDGFGQMILIKGYQSEGHDAAHPDFANVNQRAGGEEDFRLLLEKAGEYGAKIGLHINHTEAYPEAKQYSANLIAETPGWSWYDDSYHIIRENDILNKEDGMEKRLEDLSALVGDNLSMIYVDTYQDSRWQMDKLAKKINDLGWSLGTEYSEEMIKLSTWSHTLNAKNLDYTNQGNLVRFVDHQTKDIFGNTELFRGLVNRNVDAGFNGWQESKSYDETMYHFYTKVLPQRYLAHFPVNVWDSETKVMLGVKNEVVTQMVEGVNQITKDGNLIADGETVFIPWNPIEETKIYHFNQGGGTTTWTLPASWEEETSVKIFTLTDQGRQDLQTVEVKDQTVTLNALPKTSYVLYKGSDEVGTTDLSLYAWGEGTPVKDMGFDSHTFGYGWEKSSTSGSIDHIRYENNAASNATEIEQADNNKGNTHIHVDGKKDAQLTQTMTGLVPGQSYSASLFAQADQGRRVSISVTTPDGVEVSNYTDDFSVLYGNPHNDRFATTYQRVKLNFTMPEGDVDTAVIKLNAEAGSGEDSFANFDNVRVTKVGLSDLKGHDYFEDFEHVDQEFGPFVCPTKVTHSHLSERNGELTKDVIDGDYSLKIRGNGNKDQKFNYMRTVSHRVRLKPNTTYRMGLDYMITDDVRNKDLIGNTAFVIGVKSDQALAADDLSQAVVATYEVKAEDQSSHSTGDIVFTTGNYDDYYIDLLDDTYSYEFVIDNFYVDEGM